MTIMNNRLIGIGTDILEINRIQKVLEKHGQAFLDKHFTKQEQEYCRKYQNPNGRLTARFAAKEAVAKALGTGFGKELSFLDIEILNEPSGKPYVQLSEKSAKHFGNPLFLISLSHSRDYATATVIALDCREPE